MLFVVVWIHLKFASNVLLCSGVSAEGSGVIVEGSAPVSEEAVATPPAADSKVCSDWFSSLILL